MMMRVTQNNPKDLEKNYLNEGKGPLARQKTSTVTADATSKLGRQDKATDILIFDRLGKTGIVGNKGGFKQGGLFRGASDKPWTALFGRIKATSQDVYNIFRSHGMSENSARQALQNVKLASNKLGLSGFSSQAVNNEIKEYYKNFST